MPGTYQNIFIVRGQVINNAPTKKAQNEQCETHSKTEAGFDRLHVNLTIPLMNADIWVCATVCRKPKRYSRRVIMKLSFATLLSILLLGLGLVLIISAIRPFTTNFGLLLVGLATLGIVLQLIFRRSSQNKQSK